MTIPLIIATCEQAFGAPAGSITARRREQPGSDARLAAYLIADMLTRQPHRVTAAAVGRDRSSVTWGVKRAKCLVETDADFRGRVRLAFNALRQDEATQASQFEDHQ